jgi:hypothetical protein
MGSDLLFAIREVEVIRREDFAKWWGSECNPTLTGAFRLQMDSECAKRRYDECACDLVRCLGMIRLDNKSPPQLCGCTT